LRTALSSALVYGCDIGVDLGGMSADDIADVDQRLAELEHRIRLLEEASGATPPPAPSAD
jgi:hypothetical protein